VRGKQLRQKAYREYRYARYFFSNDANAGTPSVPVRFLAIDFINLSMAGSYMSLSPLPLAGEQGEGGKY
jgi:hypothetical protein